VLLKPSRPLFVTGTRCIPVNNSLGSNAVVFCACEITQLFSAVSYVVRTVPKFDFRLVTNKQTKNLRPAVILILTECTCLPSDFFANVMRLYTLTD